MNYEKNLNQSEQKKQASEENTVQNYLENELGMILYEYEMIMLPYLFVLVPMLPKLSILCAFFDNIFDKTIWKNDNGPQKCNNKNTSGKTGFLPLFVVLI